MKQVSMRTLVALFFIGLFTCIFFGLSYGHAILVWHQFEQSFHGHWHSTPLWYENQVKQALHRLIAVAIVTCAAGAMWLGFHRTSLDKKSV